MLANGTDPHTPSADRLALLYRLSQTFNSTLDLDQVLELVIDNVIRVMRAERGFVMLLDEQGDKLGQVFMVASGRDAVAYAHSLRGEWAEAREQLEPAVELMDRKDSRVVPMTINPRYAEICLRTGSPEEALERTTTAIAIAQATPSEHFEAVGRRVLSLILAERGDEAGATAALDRAIEAFERLESRLELAHSHLQRGRRFASLGNQGRAREDYQRALDLYSVCHAGHWISRTQEALDNMPGQAPSHESHNH